MIVNGIKKHLGKAKGNWAEELPTVLWSYRTTPKVGTPETPLSLTYDIEAMLLAELTVGLLRATHSEEETSSQDLRMSLDLLEE